MKRYQFIKQVMKKILKMYFNKKVQIKVVIQNVEEMKLNIKKI